MALGVEQEKLQKELETAPEPPELIARIGPRSKLRGAARRSTAALERGIGSGDTQATAAMRELIDTVTVSRDPERKGGVEVEIAGRLDHLLGPNAFPQGAKGGAMVAKKGHEAPTRGL